jgi:hypothetical protein
VDAVLSTHSTKGTGRLGQFLKTKTCFWMWPPFGPLSGTQPCILDA